MTIEEMEEGEEVDDDEDEEDLSSLYKKFREIYVLLAHIYPKETGDLVLQGLQVLVCINFLPRIQHLLIYLSSPFLFFLSGEWSVECRKHVWALVGHRLRRRSFLYP